jgi:hypothetical protein
MSNTFESGWQPKQKRVNPHDLLTTAHVTEIPRYRAPYLPHYRSRGRKRSGCWQTHEQPLERYVRIVDQGQCFGPAHCCAGI